MSKFVNENDNHYVYLFSNFNALNYFGKPNKIQNFRNQLSSNLPITQHTSVALSEIIYTKSWYNVQNEHKISLIDELGTVLNFKIDDIAVKPGYYETPDSLINELNKAMAKFPIKKTPSISYNAKENYVYLTSGKTDYLTVFPDLGEEVENILGLRNRNTYIYEYDYAKKEEAKYVFKQLDVFNNDVLKGYHPCEINAGIHYLCVYCDIITESFTGDVKSQLLRIVEIPRKTKFGDTVHIRYNDRNYKNLYSDKFQSIGIHIKDSSNRYIPFTSGQCTVVLHFKNNSI